MIQSRQHIQKGYPGLNKSLSISQVNRLYLASMILVISLGSWLQTISFSWGLLLTEILLILAPTLWMLRRNQVNLRTSAGLRRPRASLILVAIILGSGAWMVTSLVEQIMMSITGYVPVSPAGIVPTNAVHALLIFLGFVVAAPICEEILFRGSIQPAYQNYTKGSLSILVPSLLFAFFHFRLQGLPALILIAFLLGFTYWRTQSLTFTMVVHAANNFVAFIILLREGLFPEVTLPFPSPSASAFGVLMLVVGLVLLQRLLPLPKTQKSGETTKPFSLTNLWPILLAFVLFSILAVQEVSAGIQQKRLELSSQNLPVSAQWKYEIRHKGEETIGFAECQWHTSELTLNLSCLLEHDAFEIQLDNSFFSSADLKSRLTVEWDSEHLSLSSLSQENSSEFYTSSWRTEKSGNDLILYAQSQDTKYEPFSFSPTTLVQEEWAWRLMGLTFTNFKNLPVEYLSPMTWRAETQDYGQLINHKRILVLGPENIQVPAGEFQAWKVSLGQGETAWYAYEVPHTLLRFDSRMINYLLMEAD